MTTSTFGPPVFLDGPLPVAPKHSLLNVPGVLKGNEGIDPINQPGYDAPRFTTLDRWTNGAHLWPYPIEMPSSWDPCSTGTFREKAEGEGTDNPMFGAFVGYLPITCSTISIGSRFNEFRDRAEKALDAKLSFAVEQTLAQGMTLSSNPFLDDANVDILAGGAAVTPDVGLRYLEDAIGATGQQGMLHATPAVAAAWFDEQFDRDSLVTSNGNPVASGGGYSGSRPSGGSAAAAGQAWAYATGPVEVRVSEFQLIEVDEVLDREINEITYRAERYYLVTWDAALQAAVLVDWTP